MPSPSNSPKLDPDLQQRLQRLADEHHQSPDAILRVAIEHLEREEENQKGNQAEQQHPSGKPWPRRSPVGGIITPV